MSRVSFKPSDRNPGVHVWVGGMGWAVRRPFAVADTGKIRISESFTNVADAGTEAVSKAMTADISNYLERRALFARRQD